MALSSRPAGQVQEASVALAGLSFAPSQSRHIRIPAGSQAPAPRRGGRHRAPPARASATRRLLISLRSPPGAAPALSPHASPASRSSPSLRGASRTQLRPGTASARPRAEGPGSSLDTLPVQAGLSVALGFPVTALIV